MNTGSRLRGDSPSTLPSAVASLALARPLVFLLDVDGTLAPIAPRPEDARVPDATLGVLAALVARPHTRVALVTGRAAADARRLVPVPGLWVVGNHGAETEAPDGAVSVNPAVAALAPALRAAVADVAAAVAGVPGARVEDKRWSASVHVRLVADPADAARVADAARAAAARHGLAARDGKRVVELRAPVDVDKGTAALALLGRLGALGAGAGVLAAGDDVTDEDLFRRLTDVRLGGRLVTVRVGPEGEPTAAGFRVADPAALLAVLAALAEGRGSAKPGTGMTPDEHRMETG